MMKRLGLTPAAVTFCGTTASILFLVACYVRTPALDLPDTVGQLSCVAAYLVGLCSCLCAAAHYSNRSPVGLGWLALGGNCLLSTFRHLALNPLLAKSIGSQHRVYMISQSLQLPALVCVLLGALAIWWGIYRLGLGFRLKWRECAGIACLAVLIVWVARGHLSLSHSGQGGLAFLQALNLGLLVAIGGVGILLHSLSIQMGGGRLAVVMQWVAVYALIRSALTITEGWRDSSPLLWWLAFYSVPWIFAVGAAYSSWLVDNVKRGIRQQQPAAGWDLSGFAK